MQDSRFPFEQMAAVLQSIDSGANLQKVTKPESGLTGNVFVLETGGEDFILRLFGNSNGGAQIAKENLVFHQMQECRIPVPEIVSVDLSGSLLPHPYVLTRRLPGVTLASACASGMTPAVKQSLYAQVGDYLGRMHSVTFTRFGDSAGSADRSGVGPVLELESEFAGPFDSWREMHRRLVERHLRFLESTVFGDLIGSLERWFLINGTILDDTITPCLLHMDLHQGNILVSGDRVTGILDVTESLIGHNEYDLMRTELAHFRDGDSLAESAFFTGYRTHIDLPDDYQRRKPFYELSRLLVGMRCVVLYGDRYLPDTENEIDSIRTVAQQIMQSAPSRVC